MKVTFALIVVLLLHLAALGADLEPYLKSASVPFYPPLARQARIEGKVSLRFTINEQGETSDVEASTGHKMLQDAAVENAQNWKFWPARCACLVKREAVLVYDLSGDVETAESPTVTVKWFLKSSVIRVEIQAGAPAVETQSTH